MTLVTLERLLQHFEDIGNAKAALEIREKIKAKAPAPVAPVKKSAVKKSNK